MKKRTYKIISFILCFIFLGSTVAYAREEVSVTNNLETGVVDIELNEYQLNNGKLEPYEDKKNILPGDNISKIPRIQNNGYDCYVRVKLESTNEELINGIYGIEGEWIRCEDGYLYYTEILESKDYIDVFQGIRIQSDFKQDYEEYKMELTIDVDAIQAKNFIPDFDSKNPWHSVEIKEYTGTDKYDVQNIEVANPKSFEIQYDKESKKLIKNEDDFFINIPVLFPGDKYTDELKLVNESGNDIKLYFHTYSESSDLLDNVNLTIILKDGSEEKEIYNGKLNSKKISEKFLLTKISGGKEQELIYKIEVPAELDNEYTLLEDEVRWMFSVEEIEEGFREVGSGDSMKAEVALSVMIISGISLIIAIKKIKEEEK